MAEVRGLTFTGHCHARIAVGEPRQAKISPRDLGDVMLFLYRPRQTWMPYRLPREPTQQDAYNRRLQQAYAATRQVAPYSPTPEAAAAASQRDPISDLKALAELHASGSLTDAEFAAAKAKVLGADEPGP